MNTAWKFVSDNDTNIFSFSPNEFVCVCPVPTGVGKAMIILERTEANKFAYVSSNVNVAIMSFLYFKVGVYLFCFAIIVIFKLYISL